MSAEITTVGDKVKLKRGKLLGTVRFIGSIKGKQGVFFGIELDEKGKGKNNGSYQNISYFSCKKKKGLFVKKNAILETNKKLNLDALRVTVGDTVHAVRYQTNGIIRWIGEPEFKPNSGIWYGLELKNPKGKSNGTVHGKWYFKCGDKSAIFVQAKGIQIHKKETKSDENEEYVYDEDEMCEEYIPPEYLTAEYLQDKTIYVSTLRLELLINGYLGNQSKILIIKSLKEIIIKYCKYMTEKYFTMRIQGGQRQFPVFYGIPFEYSSNPFSEIRRIAKEKNIDFQQVRKTFDFKKFKKECTEKWVEEELFYDKMDIKKCGNCSKLNTLILHSCDHWRGEFNYGKISVLEKDKYIQYQCIDCKYFIVFEFYKKLIESNYYQHEIAMFVPSYKNKKDCFEEAKKINDGTDSHPKTRNENDNKQCIECNGTMLQLERSINAGGIRERDFCFKCDLVLVRQTIDSKIMDK
eukprot:44040_1